MATTAVNGTRLRYAESGAGSETIVFAHGLLCDHRMWESQIAALQKDFRCIAYDHRGQGGSDVPDDRSISHDTLAADAIALIEALDAAPCHLVGISQGGNVALRVAVQRPDLLKSVVVVSTTVNRDENVAARFRALAAGVRVLGLRRLAGKVTPVMFGPTFRADPSRAAEAHQWRRRLGEHPRSIAKSIRGVADRDSIAEHLAGITVPVLVIAGDEDELAPVNEARTILERVPQAELVVLDRCGHMVTVECPEALTDAIRSHVIGAGPAAPRT